MAPQPPRARRAIAGTTRSRDPFRSPPTLVAAHRECWRCRGLELLLAGRDVKALWLTCIG